MPTPVYRWLAAALLALAGSQALAGVYLMSPGKWPGGHIVWRYNPEGLPPGSDEAAILATVTRAFAAWSAVCQVSAEYGGLTTTRLDQTGTRHEVVLGYTALPYPQAADAAPDSEDIASGYTYFTSGVIRISNAIGANIAYNPATLVHEIGHLLGLDHSDDPFSVMFANPYNTVVSPDPYALFGDDISSCADLYGGRGVRSDTTQATQTFAASAPPRLELAVISEQGADGGASWRLAVTGAAGVDYANAYLDEQYGRSLRGTFAWPAGDHGLEVWIKSTNPRYGTDLSQNRGGQSARSHDTVRHLRVQTDAAGRLAGEWLDHLESGTPMAWSAQGRVQSDRAGPQQVYVAALIGANAYFRSPQGWSAERQPLFSFNAPGAAVFDIARGLDVRWLPPGAALYIGVGSDFQDMLAHGRYHRVRAF